ncbi:MAG: efflux RND transporter permease subunit [Clostridiales bacterium]|nr:efflux RND transporter permease subunit [Clostridiales bacterium]
MNFGGFSVKKKYVILSLMIAIIIFGIYSRVTMNTQLSPDTNAPMVTVMAIYPGASALDVSSEVSEPIEKALAKLEGVTDIKATSQDNLSIIRLTFDYSTDVDEAAIAIQNTLSRIKESLPLDLKEPQVLKFSTSDMPIMTIGIKSDSLNMTALRNIIDEQIIDDIQLIEGVASVDIIGGYSLEVSVDLDENRMKAYNLTAQQVATTISSDYLKSPGGTIKYEDKNLLIRVESGDFTIEYLKQMNIPLQDGNLIKLEDIAQIELTTGEKESIYRLDGKEMLALYITKKADVNTIDVINRVNEKIVDLNKNFPYLDLNIAFDDSVFTNQMVTNMMSSVFIAIFLTMVVIVLFIENISRSLVIAISMPMVFLSTLGLMKLFGMSLDLVTLSALILSIGFVVDGAIVVVENISSHRNLGKSIKQAAIDGTNEIAMPSIAGVTTTLIVLIPLLFIEGFVGEMFRPLSMTLIFAISSSLVVALLMIPLLSVILEPLKLIKIESQLKRITVPFNKMMNNVLEGYIKILRIAFENKKKTYILLIILFGFSSLFLKSNGMEMLPKFDSGVSYVTVEMMPGTPIEETEKTMESIEKYLSNEKDVLTYDTRIGYEEGNNLMGDFGIMSTDQGLITMTLSSRKERSESIWDFQESLRLHIDTLPGINRYVVKEKGGTAVTSAAAPISVKISGDDLDVLYHLANELEEKISSVPGVINLYKSYNDDYKQMTVKLDNSKIKNLGLTSQSISQQIYVSLEGINATTMTFDSGPTFDIQVHDSISDNFSLEDLMALELMTPYGVKVLLQDIASVQIEPRANLVESENMTYTVQILGYIQDRSFSHVVSDIENMIGSISLPKGYLMAFTGEQEALTESMGDMLFLISLSIIFVYLLLVPQFKSFIHPITIMISIPLVLIGVAPALGLSGKILSMPVLLGMILLAGTVVNNAILLVDAIIENRKKGMEINEAIEKSIRSRFRPIMMTAISDIVGMMPLAMQLALGSERFSPLAITVIGGITAATVLTIIVIPLLYTSLDSLFIKKENIVIKNDYEGIKIS